jgi:hypothetical protein
MTTTEKGFSKEYLESLAIEFLQNNALKYKLQLSDINKSIKKNNSSGKINKRLEVYINSIEYKVQVMNYLLELIDSENKKQL